MVQPRQTGGAGRSLMKGAAVLGAAAVVSKLLGTLQKIPLQNIAGDGVFGIYNAVYPLYILILTLATAGFPIAVSKFVSDYAARGETQAAKRVLKVAVLLLVATGCICFAALYFGSGTVAGLLGMAQAEPAVRSVSFALLVAPVMAALRGYFQGHEDMVPTAVSQVAEQFVRVVVMITLLLMFVSQGASPPVIAEGATFGSSAGAAAGFLVMLGYWWRATTGCKGGAGTSETERIRAEAVAVPHGQAHSKSKPQESAYALICRFAAYAVPVCLGSIAMPVLTIVDAVTVPRLLVGAGVSEANALHLFGVYNHGLPLVQLVLMIASSMAAALVPAIAGALAAERGGSELAGSRALGAVRFAWLAGLAASFGLAVTAAPINVMLFKTAEGWLAMSIVAFTAVFGTLQIVTGTVLQGAGAVMAPARSLFVAAGIKAALNLALVPLLSINGAALAAVAAYAAAAWLNVAELRRSATLPLPERSFLRKALAAALLMSAAALLAVVAAESALGHGLPALPYRLRETAAALLGIAVGAVVYPAALLRTGAVSEHDIRALPVVGAKAAALFIRLGLIRVQDTIHR